MKKFIISAAIVVFSLLGASDVSACSCLMDNIQSTGKKVNAAYKQATAVFYGKVTEVNRQEETVIVKFKVEKSWKGLNTGEVIVRTAENSAMCGFNFEVGGNYLVYTGGAVDNLQTNICTRTAAGNADARYLNKIKKPKLFAKK